MSKLNSVIDFSSQSVFLTGEANVDGIQLGFRSFILFAEDRAVLGAFTVNGGYETVEMSAETKSKVKEILGSWMIQLEQKAQKANISRIETHPESPRAAGLWARYGFQHCGDDYTMSYEVA